MKNLHKIAPAINKMQLGIANYYDQSVDDGVEKIIFYSNGRVGMRHKDGRIITSWAKWNNGDWKVYIKPSMNKPLSELNIEVEFVQ